MSIARLWAWLNVSLMMKFAVLLSVGIGMASCGYLNSSQVTHSGNSCLVFIYNAPISTSAADEITPFIIFDIIDIGPLIICVFFWSFPKYVYLAALDLTPVATKYVVSEWLCNIMSLAQYSTTASGCVA